MNIPTLKTLLNGLNKKIESQKGNWNQNNPLEKDYIYNKPFYVEEIDGQEVIHELDKKFIPSKMDCKDPTGKGSFSLNRKDSTIGKYSIAAGEDNIAEGEASFAIGSNTQALGRYSFAGGQNTTASGYSSHAEGMNTTASGEYSYAEGYNTEASGIYSHAEGSNTRAMSTCSKSEGYETSAEGYYSHAEGNSTQALADYSHAEGYNTIAKASHAHARGEGIIAPRKYGCAEGQYNLVEFLEDVVVKTQRLYRTAVFGNLISSVSRGNNFQDNGYRVNWGGTLNVSVRNLAIGKIYTKEPYPTKPKVLYEILNIEVDPEDSSYYFITYNEYTYRGYYIHVIGNGTDDENRSNAYGTFLDGTGWFAKDVYVGSSSGKNLDSGSKKLATEDYVNQSIPDTSIFETQIDALIKLDNAKTYADTAVAALVNSAPETLDTLGELAAAFEENADMVATLNAAVTNKAEKSDLDNLADLVDLNATNIESLQAQVLPTSLILADAITGKSYTIQIQNGQLVSFETTT